MNKPNVVLLISHDTGRFYSPYGITTIDTPHFDRLAEQSLTFERCFCTTPLCSPARAALTTGRYPHQNGMMGLPGNRLGGWDLAEKDRHLANVFKEHGYRTVICGFEHECTDISKIGFEEGIHGSGSGHNGGRGSIIGSGADISDWFARNPGAGVDKPFYMQIGCHETHRVWGQNTGPYSEKGIWKAPYLKDLPEIDGEMALMQSSCHDLDAGLGEIMDAFDRQGITGDTIFVVTTDHGIDMPRAKGTLFDAGVGVGLFIRYDKGSWAKGVHTDALVSHVDVYPTILEACGIPVPEGTAGISLIDILADPAGAPPVRDAVYVEKTYHDNYDPMRGLRTDRYKYILNFDAQSLYDVRFATAPRYNWFKFSFRKMNREELYDVINDPNESINLADNSEYGELCLGFKKQLAAWMKETSDPLLEGSVSSPYHVRISGEMKKLTDLTD